MADEEKRIEPLDCGNLSVNWPLWKEQFLLYLVSRNKLKESESTKIATMLLHIGARGKEIYHTLFPNDGSINSMLGIVTATTGDSSETTERQLCDVLKAFDQYSTPQKNIAMESYKFNMIVQKERQSFVDFETELRIQMRYCAFECKCGESYADRMLRDKIIIGVNDKKLQLKLLDGKDEPIEKIINTCKVFEAAN